MKNFNMNSTVRLQLNPNGLKIFESLSEDEKKAYFTQFPDDDGYCTMQLVTAFWIFGMGCPAGIRYNSTELPISLYIELDEKDIT